MALIRYPAVAGAFYESVAEELRATIQEAFQHRLGPGHLPSVTDKGPRRILGMICPHAGFQYSGAAAAYSYDALAADGKPKTILLLGTNHRLSGAAAAVDTADYWSTPLGRVPVDTELRDILCSSDLLEEDDSAHEFEHSIEVQLPWLQFLFGNTVPILPVSLGHLCHRALHSIAELLAEKLLSRDVLIIASSDFSHYVASETASESDKMALEPIIALDPDGLLDVVKEKNITMCGVGPVAIMLAACRRLGASQGRLLKYYTSGDITGDVSKVVGYASVIVEK